MVKLIVVMKINPAFALMTEGSHEKIPVGLVGTRIWTRDLPNMSPVCYHCATSFGDIVFASWKTNIITNVLKIFLPVC